MSRDEAKMSVSVLVVFVGCIVIVWQVLPWINIAISLDKVLPK